MKVITQIALLLGICLCGEVISAVLPFTFPASVISMVLLFVLLVSRLVRPAQLKQTSGFLLDNMALFFIPACVNIINYADALLQNLLPILVICVGTAPLIYFVTGHTVQLVMRLMQRKEAKRHD